MIYLPDTNFIFFFIITSISLQLQVVFVDLSLLSLQKENYGKTLLKILDREIKGKLD